MRTGRPPKDPVERFWEKVDVPLVHSASTCWEWNARPDNKGYGQFRDTPKTMTSAHRFSYELHYGDIPEGMQINHKCNNSMCVRPDHLYAGTPQDNMDDRNDAGRTARGELNGGAKLTEAEVLEVRNKYRFRKYTCKMLAKEYGLHCEVIRLIIKRKTWKHI